MQYIYIYTHMHTKICTYDVYVYVFSAYVFNNCAYIYIYTCFDTWWPGHMKASPSEVAMLQELNDSGVLTMAAIVQEAKFLDEAHPVVLNMAWKWLQKRSTRL